MANVTGTSGDDFIHVAGDGRVPPPFTNEIAQATNGDDVIRAGAGRDTIFAGGGADLIVVESLSYIDYLEGYIDGGDGEDAFVVMGVGSVDLSNITFVSIERIIVGAGQSFGDLNVTMTPEQISTLNIQGSEYDSLRMSQSGRVDFTKNYWCGMTFLGSSGADVIDIATETIGFWLDAGDGNDVVRIEQVYAVVGLPPQDNAYMHVSGGAGGDVLTLVGIGGYLSGDDGNDVLSGGSGDDALFGGLGRDRLYGGGGADRLYNDKGRDVFLYRAIEESQGASIDTIAFFKAGKGDLIDLSRIDANTNAKKDQAFVLGGSEFTGLAGELIQHSEGADTRIEADVNGDGVADFSILLTGHVFLTSADFIL